MSDMFWTQCRCGEVLVTLTTGQLQSEEGCGVACDGFEEVRHIQGGLAEYRAAIHIETRLQELKQLKLP